MINYTDRENTLKLINIEKNSLKLTLNIQKNLNKQVLTFMKNFIGNIDIELITDNSIFKYIDKATSILKKSNKNIALLESLIKKLNSISRDLNNCISEINASAETFTPKKQRQHGRHIQEILGHHTCQGKQNSFHAIAYHKGRQECPCRHAVPERHPQADRKPQISSG